MDSAKKNRQFRFRKIARFAEAEFFFLRDYKKRLKCNEMDINATFFSPGGGG